MKYTPQCALRIGYNGKYIEESVHMKLLCLQVDKNLNWTKHTDKLISMFSLEYSAL
jgi:hypothetical protein